MIRCIIAALMLLVAWGGAALAQSQPAAAPALKANATVTGDVVRIGDLVENAGPVADIAIFRAPDLGTTGTVSTDRIVDAIRPHQLIGIDTRGLTDVVVTRSSRSIGVPEISAAIAQALAAQYGFGDTRNIDINFDREVHALQVEPNASGTLQVLALAFDPRSTHFDVTLGLPSSAELRHQAIHFSGTAVETVTAVAVARPIERGELIKASDLIELRRPKGESGFFTDINAAAGLAARRALRPNQPLAVNDLMKPTIVQRNDTVTIIFQAPGVTLTLRGMAQDSGALGDTIAVLNSESKRVVQATVSGPERVTVGPVIQTHIVDNGTTAAE